MRGGKLRMINVADECGAPERIRSDNGSELIERDLRRWLADNRIETLCIGPGSPWRNGFVESPNARFREGCLGREQLWTLTKARVVIEDWRWKCNSLRPSIGLLYDIEHQINPSRLTKALAQFG